MNPKKIIFFVIGVLLLTGQEKLDAAVLVDDPDYVAESDSTWMTHSMLSESLPVELDQTPDYFFRTQQDDFGLGNFIRQTKDYFQYKPLHSEVKPITVIHPAVDPVPVEVAGLQLALPNLALQPNQANQVFTVAIENTGVALDVNGFQLELVVADGGPGGGGSVAGPTIQAANLTSAGLLFASNNSGELGAGQIAPQVFQRLTLTASGTVSIGIGSVDLFTVTFDTTGFNSGSFSWSASTSPNGASFFTDPSSPPNLDPIFTDGTLTVIPEPYEWSIFISLGLFLGGVIKKFNRFLMFYLK